MHREMWQLINSGNSKSSMKEEKSME